jgi:flagellar protein FlbD
MIHLTRLNGNPLVVNSDLLKYIESAPDTVLTLINGEKIVVLENCDEVVRRTIAYRARVSATAREYLPTEISTSVSVAMQTPEAKAQAPASGTHDSSS